MPYAQKDFVARLNGMVFPRVEPLGPVMPGMTGRFAIERVVDAETVAFVRALWEGQATASRFELVFTDPATGASTTLRDIAAVTVQAIVPPSGAPGAEEPAVVRLEVVA